MQCDAGDEAGFEIAGVCEAAGEYAGEEKEEHLDTPNPADVVLAAVEGLGVVLLEDAVAVRQAPGVQEDGVTQGDV